MSDASIPIERAPRVLPQPCRNARVAPELCLSRRLGGQFAPLIRKSVVVLRQDPRRLRFIETTRLGHLLKSSVPSAYHLLPSVLHVESTRPVAAAAMRRVRRN